MRRELVTVNRAESTAPVLGLPSLFRGVYNRVARQLGVDPSYVSRVARGERRSEAVQLALRKETKKILVGFAPFPFHESGSAAPRNGDAKKRRSRSAIPEKKGRANGSRTKRHEASAASRYPA